jgi:hypothetical protein
MTRITVLLMIVGVCFFSACSSCAMDPAVVSVWGGDVSIPKVTSLVTVSGTELYADFTSAVTVSASEVLLPGDTPRTIPATSSAGTGDNRIRFFLQEAVGIGVKAALSATVCDEKGNTLSFSLPFTGFNDRVAQLKFNEIRTEYSKPKVEYIEFVVVRSGNLAGIEIDNEMNTVRPVWEFPAAEVNAGDYLVYHLRSVEEGLVNENGAIDASGGTDSSPLARDFWDTLTSAPLKKTNVLLVRERREGTVMDAFLMAESDKTAWPNDTVRVAAEEAVSASAWLPGSLVSDAFCSTGTTTTRTIGRNEVSADSDTATDWKICATSKCTPGATNVPH